MPLLPMHLLLDALSTAHCAPRMYTLSIKQARMLRSASRSVPGTLGIHGKLGCACDACRSREGGHAEGFLPTFLISLPRSKERRALLEPVLLQHAANVTLVHAFDGRRLPATVRV